MKKFFSQLLIVTVILFAWANMAHGAAAPEQKLTYIVKEGDTLSGIAAHFNTTWPELAKINKIKNPHLIHADEVLLLRDIPKLIYFVEKDDTLSGIAAHFNTTWSELAKINGLKNPHVIYPNTALLLWDIKDIQNRSTAHTQAPKAEKEKMVTAKKVAGVDGQNSSTIHRACDPIGAITQLHFPDAIKQDLREKVMKGQFESITSEGITDPTERARKYIVYGPEQKYAFIYPESGCAWRMEIAEALPPEKNLHPSGIPQLTPDRSENEKLLTSPLGLTLGHAVSAKELSKRKSELIVLIRYLNNCATENDCDAHEAKGTVFMQRE